MKCNFCGFDFNPEDSRIGCSGCVMSKSCNKVKCPNCNYEIMPEPEFKLLKMVREWGRKIWKK